MFECTTIIFVDNYRLERASLKIPLQVSSLRPSNTEASHFCTERSVLKVDVVGLAFASAGDTAYQHERLKAFLRHAKETTAMVLLQNLPFSLHLSGAH
jgi:hypothetical protein